MTQMLWVLPQLQMQKACTLSIQMVKKKAMQIWTQGAPESNSAWFPCIDKPKNERCTQEIAITVQNKFITLSKWIDGSIDKNLDGTRTDEGTKNRTCTLPYNACSRRIPWKPRMFGDIKPILLCRKEEAKHAKRILGNTRNDRILL